MAAQLDIQGQFPSNSPRSLTSGTREAPIVQAIRWKGAVSPGAPRTHGRGGTLVCLGGTHSPQAQGVAEVRREGCCLGPKEGIGAGEAEAMRPPAASQSTYHIALQLPRQGQSEMGPQGRAGNERTTWMSGNWHPPGLWPREHPADRGSAPLPLQTQVSFLPGTLEAQW